MIIGNYIGIGTSPSISNWILATGAWRDEGLWNDNAVWID